MGLLGYIYGIQEFYGFGSYTKMAVHPAIVFIILCAGILCLHPNRGIMNMVTSQHAGGVMTRRLLLTVLGVPPILSGIILAGYRAKLYSGEVGLSLSVVFSILVFAVLIWRNAAILNKIDDRWKQAEKQRQSDERFRSLIAATSQIVWTTDPTGQILEDSPSWRAYTGQTFEEYQECGWNAVHPDDREKSARQWNQAIAAKSLYEDEYRLLSAKGHYRHFWVRGVPILADDGSIREWIGTCTEIHDRREDEIALRQSEERFRSLMQASAQIIWNTNANGELVTEQPGWSAFTGQTFAEYKGWGWLATIHPDDSAHVTSVWLEAVSSHSLYEVEFRMRRHDGEYRFMSCRAVPIFHSDGSIREWIGANTDITEKKQAEAALQEQTNLLQLILHSMSDGIIVADAAGKFLVFNPAAQQMHGSNGTDVCEGEWSQQYGLFLSDQVTPFPTEQLPLARAIRGEETKDVEMFVRHAQAPDGCWMLVNGKPLRNESGQVKGGVIACRDISDRKRSEQALRQKMEMLDFASDSIIIRDMNDRISYWNQGAENLYGWSNAEVHGGYIHTFLQTTFPKPLEEVLAEFLERGSWEGELNHTTRDGRRITVASRWTLQRDASGQPCAQLEINTDITKRKQVENAFRQSEERYRSLITATSQIVWTTDIEGRVVDIPTWRAFTGQTKAEIAGFGWLNAIHPDDRDRTSQVWMQAVQTYNLYDTEYRIRAADGNYRYFVARGVPVLNQDGSIREWVGTCTDIHDRKQAEIALEQAKDAAEAANRAKSEFLANMSHELRTPLNGVIGYAQILQRTKTLTEEDRSRIEVIHQCGSHLLTLINDILDLSKIEARKTELLPTDFHLPAFLQGVAEMCRIRAELKGIKFEYESAPELPIGIRADEKRLRQVLINLLSNAIKFTDVGSVTFLVSFASEEKIRFEVRDTGIGIPQEKLHAIFQPFEQVSDTKRQSEGTGLGLAISQEIVALMGSTIEVQSEVGVGSIFRFDVEFTQVDEWVKTAQTDRHGQIIGIKNGNPRVLVVDDKWENRSVISNLLSPIGFEVLEASDGNKGWQQIQEFHPDLVITDLLMPDLGGFELIKQIRESEALKDLIVIVSSASVFEADQYRSIEAGGNDFLPKPVLAVELFQKLQKYLKLEWIYEVQQPMSQPETDDAMLIAPPAAELDTLYELAMKGNLKGIIRQAALLEQMDAKYSLFAKRLHQLAKGFQDQAVLALIQSYR